MAQTPSSSVTWTEAVMAGEVEKFNHARVDAENDHWQLESATRAVNAPLLPSLGKYRGRALPL